MIAGLYLRLRAFGTATMLLPSRPMVARLAGPWATSQNAGEVTLTSRMLESVTRLRAQWGNSGSSARYSSAISTVLSARSPVEREGAQRRTLAQIVYACVEGRNERPAYFDRLTGSAGTVWLLKRVLR